MHYCDSSIDGFDNLNYWPNFTSWIKLVRNQYNILISNIVAHCLEFLNFCFLIDSYYEVTSWEYLSCAVSTFDFNVIQCSFYVFIHEKSAEQSSPTWEIKITLQIFYHVANNDIFCSYAIDTYWRLDVAMGDGIFMVATDLFKFVI